MNQVCSRHSAIVSRSEPATLTGCAGFEMRSNDPARPDRHLVGIVHRLDRHPSEGVARRRTITTGAAKSNELVEVTSGLSIGDRLIASGRETLIERQRSASVVKTVLRMKRLRRKRCHTKATTN